MIGGFETSSKQVVKAVDEKQAHNVLDQMASTWRDEDGADWDDDKGYYFDGGGICVHVGRIVEVSEEEYKTLVKYL